LEFPNLLQDKFLEWLGFANAGMMHPGNLSLLDYAISHLPSTAPMIEIGSFCGLSTNIIGYLKLKHGVANRLYCADEWRFENAAPDGPVGTHPHLMHAEYRQFVKETFLRNVGFFSGLDLPILIELNSDAFFHAWDDGEQRTDVFGRPAQLGGPISFAFIDGNHSYEFARRDFENIDRHLEPGGLILFDDSTDGSAWEVCRVVAEVAAGGRYELVSKTPNYLFRRLAS
jgi:hypothetical protein